MARTGMGRAWIYREARAGRFPAPTKLNRGGASGWDAAAVELWIAAQFETPSSSQGGPHQ
jgi:predicted DNA-binding transcriptional regulator AlpA